MLADAVALLGTGIAWLVFSGQHSDMAYTLFQLSVTPEIFGLGLEWGLAMAVLGAVFPAIRAARLFVAEAMRPR